MLDFLIIQVTPFQGKFHCHSTFFSVPHQSPGSSPAPISFLWPCDLFSDLPSQEANPKCCHFTWEQGKQLIFLSFSSCQYLHLHRLNQVVLLQEDHSFSEGILSLTWEGAQAVPLQDGGVLGCSTKGEALYTGASYLNSLAWCSTSVNKSYIRSLLLHSRPMALCWAGRLQDFDILNSRCDQLGTGQWTSHPEALSPIRSYIHVIVISVWGIPWGSAVNNSLGNAGDAGSIPGSERSSGEGNGYPLQYSYLGNPMDRGTCWAVVHGGLQMSRTRLSD